MKCYACGNELENNESISCPDCGVQLKLAPLYPVARISGTILAYYLAVELAVSLIRRYVSFVGDLSIIMIIIHLVSRIAPLLEFAVFLLVFWLMYKQNRKYWAAGFGVAAFLLLADIRLGYELLGAVWYFYLKIFYLSLLIASVFLLRHKSSKRIAAPKS